MANLTERENAAVEKTEGLTQNFFDIVNGTETQTITTIGGVQIPTFRKMWKDIGDQFAALYSSFQNTFGTYFTDLQTQFNSYYSAQVTRFDALYNSNTTRFNALYTNWQTLYTNATGDFNTLYAATIARFSPVVVDARLGIMAGLVSEFSAVNPAVAANELTARDTGDGVYRLFLGAQQMLRLSDLAAVGDVPVENGGAGSAGTMNKAARADHKHPIEDKELSGTAEKCQLLFKDAQGNLKALPPLDAETETGVALDAPGGSYRVSSWNGFEFNVGSFSIVDVPAEMGNFSNFVVDVSGGIYLRDRIGAGVDIMSSSIFVEGIHFGKGLGFKINAQNGLAIESGTEEIDLMNSRTINHAAGDTDTDGANVGQLKKLTNFSGQVRVDYGTTLSLTGAWTANTERQFIFSTATSTVNAAATKWAKNFNGTTPTNAQLNPQFWTGTGAAGRLKENDVPRQTHRWRINGTYSGKANAETGNMRFALRNTVSGFVATNEITMPTGTAGNFTMEITTIADSSSIMNGYQLMAMTSFADTALTVQISSITRISEATENVLLP